VARQGRARSPANPGAYHSWTLTRDLSFLIHIAAIDARWV
jgi:hypothetical protein